MQLHDGGHGKGDDGPAHAAGKRHAGEEVPAPGQRLPAARQAVACHAGWPTCGAHRVRLVRYDTCLVSKRLKDNSLAILVGPLTTILCFYYTYYHAGLVHVTLVTLCTLSVRCKCYLFVTQTPVAWIQVARQQSCVQGHRATGAGAGPARLTEEGLPSVAGPPRRALDTHPEEARGG